MSISTSSMSSRRCPIHWNWYCIRCSRVSEGINVNQLKCSSCRSIDIRSFNLRSIKPAIGDLSSKHDARSTGRSTWRRISFRSRSSFCLSSSGTNVLEFIVGCVDTDADEEPSDGFWCHLVESHSHQYHQWEVNRNSRTRFPRLEISLSTRGDCR